MVEDADKDCERSPFQLGVLQGNFDSLKERFNLERADTSARFLRLEDKITEGFKQSQTDREAGNKTLGDMITANAAVVTKLSAQISQAHGAVTATDKIIGVIIVVAAAALGGWLSHL